ncbi:MAG: zinc ribbon domain-containing protein [Clostridia bacterium]|nr:zinc ribbon domain-containing protein [Clostridia bacterium]
MAYCWNCGCELEENAKVCPSCNSFQTSPEEDSEHAKRLKVKFTVPKIIFCVIAVAFLVVLFWVGNFLNRGIYEGGGYQTALDNFVGYSNGKISKMKSLAPREYWALLEAESDFKIDDYIKEAESAAEREQFDAETADESSSVSDAEEKDIRLSYRVVTEKEAGDDYLARINAKLSERFGTDEKLVTEAYLVSVDFIKGDEENGEITEKELAIIRIRDNWYPMSAARFLIELSSN